MTSTDTPRIELCFPESLKFLSVRETFAEYMVIKTLVLLVFNHNTAIVSAAVHMVGAGKEHLLIEMGSRRTHEHAVVAAARSAGFAVTIYPRRPAALRSTDRRHRRPRVCNATQS